ncbi:hypothetical protein LJC71_06855 [Desulfosarcina sp. OttesenSCG-928-A07]|nr:hypothetical protein [Desulfosarcina sp. OttesenSCG-928-A07]
MIDREFSNFINKYKKRAGGYITRIVPTSQAQVKVQAKKSETILIFQENLAHPLCDTNASWTGYLGCTQVKA